MSLLRFCQPSDYVYRGRNVWFNPAEVTSITKASDSSCSQCDVTLKDGRSFRLDMRAEDCAEAINKACTDAIAEERR